MKRLLKPVHENVFCSWASARSLKPEKHPGLPITKGNCSHAPFRGEVEAKCGTGRVISIRNEGYNIGNGLFTVAAAASCARLVDALEPIVRAHEPFPNTGRLNPHLHVRWWNPAARLGGRVASIFDTDRDASASACLTKDFIEGRFENASACGLPARSLASFCDEHEVGRCQSDKEWTSKDSK